jgi:hypothetical protein
MTQFTGSSRVAESLAKLLHGRIKLEDAGFDWKVLFGRLYDFILHTNGFMITSSSSCLI